MTSGPDRPEVPPRDGADGQPPDGPGGAGGPAGEDTGDRASRPPDATVPDASPSDGSAPASGADGTGVEKDARRLPGAAAPAERPPAPVRARRLRFWESPAPAPAPARDPSSSPADAADARSPDAPADPTTSSPGADGSSARGPDDAPAGEPGAAPGVEGGVTVSDLMDTTSMPAIDAPDRLPPFTDPPGWRLPDLRRHLRFWEVAPESVAAEVVERDPPAAPQQRPVWEWADDPGVDPDRGSPALAAVGAGPPTPPVPASPPRFGTLAELRAESRELQRRIHDMQFDLGGLHVEMARAAAVDHALLEARALELVAAGDRLVAVERAMEARHRGEDPSWATLVPCSSCGAPRPQDASFCPYCGSSVAPSRTWRTG